MKIDVINGLLGAGKTTYLLNLLEEMEPGEKTAVLVNEFGEIGIDGDILGGHGANVVELPNGCICCTLTADLRSQVREIAENFAPGRLLIEPTGIATIKNLLGILNSLSLEKYIDEIRVILVIDAANLREIISQNRSFVENQIKAAHVIAVNKCDRVDAGEISWIMAFIRSINTTAEIFLTIHGRVISRDGVAEIDSAGKGSKLHNGESIGEEAPEVFAAPETPLKRYEQFSTTSNGIFDLKKLRDLFGGINRQAFGLVDRAKGIFRITGDNWIRLDLASGEIEESGVRTGLTSSKIIVIGTNLRKDLLKEEFRSCQL